MRPDSPDLLVPAGSAEARSWLPEARGAPVPPKPAGSAGDPRSTQALRLGRALKGSFLAGTACSLAGPDATGSSPLWPFPANSDLLACDDADIDMPQPRSRFAARAPRPLGVWDPVRDAEQHAAALGRHKVEHRSHHPYLPGCTPRRRTPVGAACGDGSRVDQPAIDPQPLLIGTPGVASSTSSSTPFRPSPLPGILWA
jgi:hypothetical protein